MEFWTDIITQMISTFPSAMLAGIETAASIDFGHTVKSPYYFQSIFNSFY